MLEVVQKADRLHVEENLERSMSASPASENQSIIQFKDVRTMLSHPVIHFFCLFYPFFFIHCPGAFVHTAVSWMTQGSTHLYDCTFLI